MEPSVHWQTIYRTRQPTDVGWYEADPTLSRRLVEAAVRAGARSVIDVGGGASFLADHLLDCGLERVAVLDISAAALELARQRLGERAAGVEWIVADVTRVGDVGRFDVWHDRAVFHFLIDAESRRRYIDLALRTVEPGGTAIIATFAPDGPERCSGLPVQRYSPESLVAELGSGWQLQHSERHVHTTPGGVDQQFVYSVFRRSQNGA